MTVIYDGRIAGEFDGFDSDKIFEMNNGTKWIQVTSNYWYHYAYMPHVIITHDSSAYYLTVADHTVKVRRY